MTTRASTTASAPVGKYALEVGADTGSTAQFASTRSSADKAEARRNSAALRAALAESETSEPLTPLESLEELESTASAVADRIEHANSLFKAAAENRLLDRDVLTGEIGALLGLLDRLDREGRYEEEIRVAKALHGLCVLAFRWLDLLRSLRAALAAARAAGDGAGQAWALNELGALHVCAGAPGKAKEYLEQALELHEKLGDAGGQCATRHNLDSARRDIERPLQVAAPRPLVAAAGVVGALPWRRFLGVKFLFVLALLLAAPTAVGWFATRDARTAGPDQTKSTTTETGNGPSGGALQVELRPLGKYLRGVEQLDAAIDPDEAKGEGVRSVAFQRAAADGSGWKLIVRDEEPPYAARLETRQLEDGSYRLRAVARDGAGDHPSKSVAVVIDNTPPEATLPGGGFLHGDGVRIEVDASDALSGLRRRDTRVEFSRPGQNAWAQVPTPWVTTELEDGPYDLRVHARDRAGNPTTSDPVTRWIDNSDPDVELTSPTEFVNASDAEAGAYTVTATAPARDVERVEFFRCADESEDCSSEDWVALGVDEKRPYRASWEIDADGNRALRAVAIDRALRRGSDVVNVIIDRRAPIRGAIRASSAWDAEKGSHRVDLTIVTARDNGSGVAAGSELIERASGTPASGLTRTCALDSEFTRLAEVPPYFLSDYEVDSSHCYVYVYEVEDNAGNVARFLSSAVSPEPGPG